MQFSAFDIEDPGQGFNLEREVFIILQQHGATRLHDGLLCQAYHVIFDDWQHIDEAPNHWIVGIPQDRAAERSDASIVRAKREVQHKVHEPSLGLESYVDPAWSQEEWQQYLQKRRNGVLQEVYGEGILDSITYPQSVKEQVAWLLTNYPETRGSDKTLILKWYELFGGWRKGGTTDDLVRWAIPKAYQWQDTTPESLTAARRKWHQQGIFLPDEATQERRKDLEKQVRQGFREGASVEEVLH